MSGRRRGGRGTHLWSRRGRDGPLRRKGEAGKKEEMWCMRIKRVGLQKLVRSVHWLLASSQIRIVDRHTSQIHNTCPRSPPHAGHVTPLLSALSPRIPLNALLALHTGPARGHDHHCASLPLPTSPLTTFA